MCRGMSGGRLCKAGVYVRTQVSPTGMFQPQHYLPLTPLMDKVSEQSTEGSDAPTTHTRTHTHTLDSKLRAKTTDINLRLDTNLK